MLAIFNHRSGCKNTFRKEVEMIGSNYKTFNGHTSAWPMEMCKCGKAIYGEVIRGTFKEGKKCDGRCLSARGSNCECSCAGANHGGNY